LRQLRSPLLVFMATQLSAFTRTFSGTYRRITFSEGVLVTVV